MPSRNVLHLKSQTGHFVLDDAACYEAMSDDLGELYEESGAGQHMFRCDDNGTLQVFDGGYDSDNSWGNRVVTWGWKPDYFLDILARNLTGNGTAIFVYTPEGNPPSVYSVIAGNVEEIA